MLRKNLNAIKVISFDLDDTLWENHSVIKRASSASLAELNRHHNGEPISFAELGPIKPQLINAQPDLQWDLTALRQASYEALLIERGTSAQIAAAGAHQAVAVFSKLRSEITPFADTVDSLAALSKRWPIAAITNGNCNLFVQPFGHYFSFYVSPMQAKAAKPDAKIYQFTAEHIGVEAAEILHVGDCPRNDIDAANAAGCQTVWFNPQQRRFDGNSRADYEISQLAQLQRLLE